MTNLDFEKTRQLAAHKAWRHIIEPQSVTIMSRVRSLLGIVNPYTTYAFGPDLSHYDGGTLPEKIAKYKGVNLIIAKMGGTEDYRGAYIDDNWNQHAQLAWDLDVPLLGYWFVGPRIFIEGAMTPLNADQCTNEQHPVIGPILQALHNGRAWKQIKALFLDYEAPSYWCNAPYRVDSFWMRRYFEEDCRNRLAPLMGTLVDGYLFPTFEIGTYSRKNFIDEHDTAPDSIQQYLISRPELQIWAAGYPREIPNTATVAEIRASWMPDASWKPAAFGWSALRDMPVEIWQFAGDPDWNVFMGTPAQLYARLGFVPHGATPPPVDPPPAPVPTKIYFATVRQTAVGLKLRTAPSTTAPILDYDFRPLPKFEIAGAPVVDGVITWASLGKVYFAVRQGTNDPYADVSEVTL